MTHFVDNDGCVQKRRPQQTHNSYFIIPTSDFSYTDLLIGKWWVFIVQQNWMKFDMFRWGLINWGYLRFTEMNVSASSVNLQYNKDSLRTKVFNNISTWTKLLVFPIKNYHHRSAVVQQVMCKLTCCKWTTYSVLLCSRTNV